MFSTDLSTRSCDGHAVVALRGELDLADAMAVAAALTAVAAREPGIIVDLAALEFIDSSGVAALARGRRQARQAGGDLTLAAPQQKVMRVLATIRLADAFSVYATVEEAVGEAETLPRARPPDGLQRGARMSLTPEPEHLNNHHRNTLRQLFQHPVSHNIEWNAVVSLLEAVGSVTEQPHGKVAVVVGSETEYFDPPAHKDIDTQAVVNLRRMLGRAGYGLAAGRDGSTSQ